MKETREKPKYLCGSFPFYESNKGFHFRNYGITYAYPPPKLIPNLKELIVFSENTLKEDIPEGSVWVYEPNSGYIPRILKNSVGCGITSAIVEKLSFEKKDIQNILHIINEMDSDIAQGDHFIDFTNGYFNFGEGTSMIFIHSHLNRGKKWPRSFTEAEVLEKKRKKQEWNFSEH